MRAPDRFSRSLQGVYLPESDFDGSPSNCAILEEGICGRMAANISSTGSAALPSPASPPRPSCMRIAARKLEVFMVRSYPDLGSELLQRWNAEDSVGVGTFDLGAYGEAGDVDELMGGGEGAADVTWLAGDIDAGGGFIAG